MSSATSARARPPAVLYDVDWDTYTRLQRALQTERRYRLTYDRGTLEIMSPLFEHENPTYVLGSFVDALTDELDMPRRSGRTVTLRRKKKQKGLEPDNCYWLASAPLLLGKTCLDLRTDPPPDLAIEVEVTQRILDRMSIYAALRVPEIWVLGAAGLAFHVLQGKKYQVQLHSVAFPRLTAADLMSFLSQVGQVDETALVRQFRAWVRQEYLKRTP